MNNEELENVRKWALACKDKNELLEQRKNCRDRNNLEAVDIVESVLDIRYPNWGTADVARTRSGGIVPTNARFQSRTQKFASQIEAYIWLVNQFAASNPNMFTSNGKTDDSYGRLLFGQRKDLAMHFAPMSSMLDKKTDKGTENDSRPVQLECGWWANTVLSGSQKFRLLEGIAQHCDIKSGEWSWEPENKTASLQKRVTQRDRGQTILDEFARQT